VKNSVGCFEFRCSQVTFVKRNLKLKNCARSFEFRCKQILLRSSSEVYKTGTSLRRVNFAETRCHDSTQIITHGGNLGKAVAFIGEVCNRIELFPK
jgi:hypothetical protein